MKKKIFFLATLISLSVKVCAQIVSIPDPIFKSELLSSSANNTIAKDLSGNYFSIDTNGDGEIQISEAEQVGELAIQSNVQNYQGISSFIYIKKIKLQNNSFTPIAPLTISNLGLLTDVHIELPQSNQYSNVILNNCSSLTNFTSSESVFPVFSATPILKNVEITISETYYPNDYSTLNNTLSSLQAVSSLEKVSFLYAGSNSLTTPLSFDLSNHSKLNEVNTNIGFNKLDLSNCNLLSSLDLGNAKFNELTISNSPLLTQLNTQDGVIKKLMVNNCATLKKIKVKKINNLHLENCVQLKEIDVSEFGKEATANPLLVTNCPNIKTLSLGYQYPSFDASSFSNLEHLTLDVFSTFPSDPNFNEELEYLKIDNLSNLKTLSIQNYKKLNHLIIDSLEKLESVKVDLVATYLSPEFDFSTDFLQSLDIQNCPMLSTIELKDQPGLKTTKIKNCPKIVEFIPYGLVQLWSTWYLQSLEIDNCELLNTVGVSGSKLTNLKITNCPSLQYLYAEHNLLTSFDLTNSTGAIKELMLSDNNLTVFNNISAFPNLEILFLSGNKITDLDLSGHEKLSFLEYKATSTYTPGIQNNPPTFLKTVNLNDCLDLSSIYLQSSVLEKVFIKNGHGNSLDISDSPTLQYVCTDDNQISAIQDYLSNAGFTNVNVNSYCSFVPGGKYNTITGLVRFDHNNNGCDTDDPVFEHMKLKITGGNDNGETFVQGNGKYNFYVHEGNFTIAAEPENPSLFTVLPSSFSTSFPNNNNNIFTQDICVTSNGNANDLEVVVAPITNAVPGSEAKYKLMWRNKGNTTMSGTATLTFDPLKMDFVSSLIPATISGNQIHINFTNLKPYANDASEILFNIHKSDQTENPTHLGDIISLYAIVNPVSEDLNAADNSFNIKQTAVNSFDNNDIECLEGNSIPLTSIGSYIHYIVNFNNTGTSSASNIVIEMDMNPAYFDIPSLQVQNSSHLTYTRIKGNKAEFIMQAANLGIGGHGNILMKIKSRESLNPGDQIINKANIYFDYKFPIETSHATTDIKGLLKTAEAQKDNSVALYPNPTKGDIMVSADSTIKTVEIYDIQGRIIQKQIGIGTQQTKIDLNSRNASMYYFKIITDKGSIIKKVVKQ